MDQGASNNKGGKGSATEGVELNNLAIDVSPWKQIFFIHNYTNHC